MRGAHSAEIVERSGLVDVDEPYGIMDATHRRWFTGRTVRRLFDSAGFAVIEPEHTAGAALPRYRVTRPWRWMSHHARTAAPRRLVRIAPRLVGRQFVLVAAPTPTAT